MPTKRKWLYSTVAAALLPAMLSGCASSSLPSPPVIGMKPQATPLPVSVSRIESRSSEAWLHEVQSYFELVESSLSSEMPR